MRSGGFQDEPFPMNEMIPADFFDRMPNEVQEM